MRASFSSEGVSWVGVLLSGSDTVSRWQPLSMECEGRTGLDVGMGWCPGNHPHVRSTLLSEETVEETVNFLFHVLRD